MTEFFLTFSLNLRPASSEKEHYNLGIYLLLHKVSSFLSTQIFSLYLCGNLAKEHKQALFCFIVIIDYTVQLCGRHCNTLPKSLFNEGLIASVGNVVSRQF